jgi:hypothetical protein
MQTWMRLLARAGLVVSALAGCGEVKDDSAGGKDGRACAGNTPQACGPGCVQCPMTGDRTVPTCDGTACGLACRDSAPKCSDNTCSRLLWTFEDGKLDGITPRSPNGLALAVRNFNGAQALAIDVQNLGEISFRVPICLSGVVDVRPKTFSFQVFFQGGSSTGIQYYVQASVPAPQNGAYLANHPGVASGMWTWRVAMLIGAPVSANHPGVASGMWTPFSSPLSMSQFSGTCSDVTIQAGSLGAQFSGTIWFDDFKIE